MKSVNKPSKIDKVKWALYTAVGISSLVLFGCDTPNNPKIPKNLGD